MKKHDVIVIGGGPGGSVAATVLAQAGLDVLVIEREVFPRFHIGESLLPASMPIFKEIGFYPILDGGKYLRKYGARFIDYSNDDEVYFGFQEGLNPDIPMAFEVERALFDIDILAHAVSSGAKLHQPETVTAVDVSPTGAVVKTNLAEYACDYVIDVTGRDSFLGKKLSTREANKGLNNVAVFAQYKGVQRYEGTSEGDITIGLLPEGAWTWIIPFKDGITSVGVVSSSSQFAGESDKEAYLNRCLRGSSRVSGYMEKAERVEEVRTIGNYSHTSDKFFGERWILAGDAALFLDPIFSSGVHMSISSSSFAAQTILLAFKENKASLTEPGRGDAYESKVRLGAKRFRNLIMMFYEGSFVGQMKKVLHREHVRRGFTSAVAGDVWNEDNYLFEKNVL
jgi:flavin-dependent dehydrogenase